MDRLHKTNLQRFAFLALVLAGLALISSAIAGLILALVKLNMFTVANPANWKTAAWVSLALVIIGISIFGIMDPDRVRRFLTGRQARYGSNSLIMTIAVLGILFVANFLAFQNPQKIDFTEDKSHTLAPETIKALSTLPGKVNAVAFFSQRSASSATTARELLQNFKVNSGGKFDYQFTDPDTNPIAARQAGVTGDGKIMLIMGDKKEIASFADETELTRAMIRLISPESRVVYFLTGEGEADITNSGQTSMTVAKSTLEGKNYTVKPLNLLADNKIPEDALVVVVAGPTKPLSTQEVDLLKKYVDGGGGLVVAENPLPLTDFGDAPDPLGDYISSDWGIHLDNDMIIDQANSDNPLNAISYSLSSHEITRSMTLAAILPNARSISLSKAPDGVEITSLAQTTDRAWGETDFSSFPDKVTQDPSKDIPGPLTLAASGENTKTKGRVAVFGNSLFANDQFFDAYGNGDLFVNAVDWSGAQENLIQITPRQPVERTFKVPSQVQWLMILLGSVFIIPGLVIAAGISNWLTRRARG